MSMSEEQRQYLLATANAAAGDELTSWPAIAALALDYVGQLQRELDMREQQAARLVADKTELVGQVYHLEGVIVELHMRIRQLGGEI